MPDPAPIQIFRPGRHVSVSGDVLEFSAADLAATATAYDPAKHEAPIVVGHPRTDAPAYGWVKSLAAGAALEATPQQVDPAFADMVAAGRFKKISASFFTPDSPINPVPGVYYLRHVGFLGAQPPAVKGLRNPEFAAGTEGVIEFGDFDDVLTAGLWRRLREWIISRFGLDEADKTIPDYTVARLDESARQPEEAPQEAAAAAAYSEPTRKEVHVTPEEISAFEAENTRLKQLLAEWEARERAAAAAARHAGHAAFADGLLREGRLLPGHVGVCVAALDFVAGQESVVEFGEGEKKQPLGDALTAFLQGLPKQVEFAEVSAASAVAGEQSVSFAAPAGHSVDPKGLDLHRRVAAHAAKHNVSYDAALAAVGRDV